MSGGIAQLVAVGAQDVHLVGQPEVSFFRSTYKRHTNFSQTVERQVIQGNVSNNGMSTVRFERKGDLLGYVYLVANNGTNTLSISDWKNVISKVELLIGGQVIDDQDSIYSTLIAPSLSATTSSKSLAGGLGNTRFYPLRFSFCENWQSALPLISLQYHDVELRITWGPNATDNSAKWDVYANYAYLDTMEREMFAAQPQNMIMTQVQKAIASGSRIQELNFNHPVKYLASADGSDLTILDDTNKLKLQINGTDVADFKFADPHFTTVPLYYHSSNGVSSTAKKLFFYPFCLESGKLQPTGSLNFSRLDSARIINSATNCEKDIYAVNYNVLRIENGMGGLLYSN
uniref:Major capsid protein n=1 Tax=Mantoniella tinhauana virus 1 TaxID=3111543 RepID=A0AB38ZMA3_9VIRU